MTVEATNCHRAYAVQGQSLGVNFVSSVVDFKDMPICAVQILWSGIVGSLDGVFRLYGSLLPDVSSFDPDGTEIDGSAITPHAASGSRLWIRDRVGFRYLLVRYAKASITSGVVDIVALGKKS